MKTSTIIILVIILIVIIAGVYLLTKPQAPAQNQTQSNPPASTNTSSTSSTYDIQGMKVEILKQGTGEGAKSGDLVTVNYTGTLADGTTFDSNVDPKFSHVTPFPFTINVDSVIQGWQLGLIGMKVGEQRKLTIPPELAYGPGGHPPVIPPNATLTFVIDLLKIN